MSELPDRLVTDCRLIPCHDPQATLASLLSEMGSGARAAFIPCAGLVLPSVGPPQEVEVVAPHRKVCGYSRIGGEFAAAQSS